MNVRGLIGNGTTGKFLYHIRHVIYHQAWLVYCGVNSDIRSYFWACAERENTEVCHGKGHGIAFISARQLQRLVRWSGGELMQMLYLVRPNCSSAIFTASLSFFCFSLYNFWNLLSTLSRKIFIFLGEWRRPGEKVSCERIQCICEEIERLYN